MKTYSTYQYRGYCTRRGHERLDAIFVECSILYNAALQERRDAYKMADKSISYYDQATALTQIRKDIPEWGSMSLQVGRGVLRRVDRAFQAFFRRVRQGEKPGFPRFRSRHRYQTIEVAETTPAMLKCSQDERRAHVKIKGLPTITLRTKRPLPEGSPKTLMITRRPTGIVVSMAFEVERKPLPANPQAVGIDMGVTKRMTLSNGGIVERRTIGRRRENRLRQEVSRCKKGSSSRKKRVRSLGRETYRNKIRNRSACHEVTTELVRSYGMIALEDLRIGNMTRSAAGTAETPGRNVAAKSGLNRSILEQTWGVIRQQLNYKAEWAGRELVVVDPRHTSQTCSACGVMDAASRTGERYECAHCGKLMDADVNAAINILARARGRGNVRPGVKTRTAA